MWTERREWKLVSVVGIGVAGINAAEYCERAFSRETWRRDSSDARLRNGCSLNLVAGLLERVEDLIPLRDTIFPPCYFYGGPIVTRMLLNDPPLVESFSPNRENESLLETK